jgi:hypothetical protein
MSGARAGTASYRDRDATAGGCTAVSPCRNSTTRERAAAHVGAADRGSPTSSILAGRLAAQSGLDLWPAASFPVQTAPVPLGSQRASAPRTRPGGPTGGVQGALVLDHLGSGAVGRTSGGGLGRAFPARRRVPRPQATSRHGGLPSLDQKADLAHLSGPAGGADLAAPAARAPRLGLGPWELVAHAGVESSQAPCLHPRPPPSVLATPGGVFAIPHGPGRLGENPTTPGPQPRPLGEGSIKFWKPLSMKRFVC